MTFQCRISMKILIGVSDMQAINQTTLISDTLQTAFMLQDEIRELKDQVKLLEKSIELKEARIKEIVVSHQQSGMTAEGPFFIEEKPGRETVDISLLKKRFPWVAEKVIKTSERATKKDISKYLSGEDAELVCKRSASTYEIGYDIRAGAEQ